MKRASVATVLIILVIAAYAAYLIYLHWPVVIEGVVDHKSLVGVRNGFVRTLLLVAPHAVLVKDEEVASLLGNRSLDPYNFTVNGLLEAIKSRYDNVYGVVSIRTRYGDPANGLEPGETLGYIIDVELFDHFRLGSNVKVAVTRASGIKIVWVVEVGEQHGE